MGAKDSKPCCISYEDAVKRVTDAELRRLKDAFKRSANLNCVITKPGFIKDVLGEFVPLKLAEYIFQACGGTSKGITFKDLLSGLVLLTRGEEQEKVKFIFCLCCNESGTHVYKDDLVRLVQACDNGYVPEAIADCFSDSERVSFDEFKDWLLHRRDATSLTRWLLLERSTVTLSNELETPTFYQTLAGVTHLQETDIIDLEKRYWILKTQSRSGRLDLDTLRPLICPPIPVVLCEGIFNAFDENQDGHIDFKEMACGISACCRGPLTERQKFCFKIFDQDRDGILSEAEVKHMVSALLFVKNENKNLIKNEMVAPLSVSEVTEIANEIMASHDPNQAGALTLEEYLFWTVNNNLPLEFLNILFQVCHVIFGLRPYTKEDEGEIIRSWIEREERRGMQVGQFWYLIASDWWISWNEYVDFQGTLASGCCTPTYPSGSLKRNSKMQRRVDGSVAQTDDGSSNVVLSSITSVGDDSTPSLSESINSIFSSLSSDGSSLSSKSIEQVGNGTSAIKKSSSLQPPELVRTPNHSPNVHRRNLSHVPQRPTSIDNSSLIVPNTLKVIFLTGEGGRLRRNPPLILGKDFELVPEAVWRALSQWYGGSPPLPRQVILSRNGVPELELYLITLKLYRHQPNAGRPVANPWAGAVGNVSGSYSGGPSMYVNNLPPVNKRYLAYLASFSNLATLRQIFEFICMRLRLRLEETRLWLYKDDSNLTLLEEENCTLLQLGFEDNEQILIEVRNKDQTWPEEMTNVMNAKFDQKSQGPTEKGATGLNNLGNTCFMNAALQCVSNTRALTAYFNSNYHLYELNRTNQHGMKGHIAKRYGDLVQDLWSGTSRTVAPLKLRLTIGKYAPRFNGFQQHDSQELLAFLIDGLHEDLNRVHEKPYTGLKDSDGRPDEEVASEAWENHVRRERSIIVDLFHGQLQSTVRCKVCGHTSVRFDPFNYLSLPLPMESCIHLEIVVIRLDGSKPVKYGLQLNHDDKYITLKQQLGKLCNINPQQLLVAEVSDATFKSIPGDEHRIRIVAGNSFFAYELYIPQEIILEDDNRQPRETHTLTQIQRMPLSDSSSPKVFTSPSTKKVPVVAVNGDVPKPTEDREAGDAPGKMIFSLGDSDSDSIGSQLNSPPAQQPLGPWILGGAPSYSSSMTSSIVSNSSTSELSSEFYQKNFVIAYHRKMIRQDVYFLSSQKCRPTLFGLPLILPCHEMTTNQDLYQAVWIQVARLVSPLPPSETAVSNHALDCDDSLGYEYPFTLKAVQRNGYLCAHCPWYRFCRGCKIECCDADFNFGSAVIAIDWDPTALHLRYQTSLERDFADHESVNTTRRLQTEPINLHDCLEAFTNEEQLGEAEKYYCSKCKEHQLASKKLNIWRLPPILIVHLKRFQLLNGRWVKSHKIVKFPFENFDPTDYLARVPRETILEAWRRKETSCNKCSSPGVNCSQELQSTKDGVHLDHNENSCCVGSGQSSNQNNQSVPSQNKLNSDYLLTNNSSNEFSGVVCNGVDENHKSMESDVYSDLQDFHQHRLSNVDPFSLKYKLYALACHSGILGGGHYVCYACNPNQKWYCYNDSSCKEVQRDQIDTDSAYMLFYEREGMDYLQYMPDVKGKIPDTSDIDAEFETDFRKMCSLS
ncbi:ubiquitin carboxyl-terminal hydrolase 32 [Trichonephila clavata]|uniref:Ubiquitin carboxyl-terminal hydrolase 32 n=1 Tax=Trichonephila clavata TaxID=2740835 RepID=A0A8X6LGX5_TRICU|nr:ubiquitin carboxyl-terminal hydrolase 32 [Trichonephila clavata]